MSAAGNLALRALVFLPSERAPIRTWSTSGGAGLPSPGLAPAQLRCVGTGGEKGGHAGFSIAAAE